MLLDELTNGLDTATLAALENAVVDFPGCVVVTAHDRWFLDRVDTHMLAWEDATTKGRNGIGSSAISMPT